MGYSSRNQILTRDGRTICMGTNGERVEDLIKTEATITDSYFCTKVPDGFLEQREEYDGDRIHKGQQGLAIQVNYNDSKARETLYVGGKGKFRAVKLPTPRVCLKANPPDGGVGHQITKVY